jgi:exonuclease III
LKDLETYIHPHTEAVGDLITLLSSTDRSSKKNQRYPNLNHTIDQMDIADVYRIFHPFSAQYTLFSEAQGTSSKIDHTLGHEASLSKYKKIEIIPSILSDHNVLKLELNNKNNSKNKQLETEHHIAQ